MGSVDPGRRRTRSAGATPGAALRGGRGPGCSAGSDATPGPSGATLRSADHEPSTSSAGVAAASARTGPCAAPSRTDRSCRTSGPRTAPHAPADTRPPDRPLCATRSASTSTCGVSTRGSPAGCSRTARLSVRPSCWATSCATRCAPPGCWPSTGGPLPPRRSSRLDGRHAVGRAPLARRGATRPRRRDAPGTRSVARVVDDVVVGEPDLQPGCAGRRSTTASRAVTLPARSSPLAGHHRGRRLPGRRQRSRPPHRGRPRAPRRQRPGARRRPRDGRPGRRGHRGRRG